MIRFRDLIGKSVFEFSPQRLIVAGFTGRDRAIVNAHLDELGALGVPVPDVVPVFYQVAPALLTQAERIQVSESETSGEVEPVIMVDSKGDRWLTVGSDHTDRNLERTSIELSKSACPKVVASAAVRIADCGPLDAIQLRSWTNNAPTPYQIGAFSQLLPLDDLIRELERTETMLGPGDVMFLGTFPASDGRLRSAKIFSGEMSAPDPAWRISFGYAIEVGA